jgi:putative ABC transport system permease protein
MTERESRPLPPTQVRISARAAFRESFASSLAAPVVALLTILMVAGMCASVLLTSGRAAGAQQSVIASIDSAGTRLIVVTAQSGAGLSPGVLGDLGAVDGIEWMGAFGAASDVRNGAFERGTRVPMRFAWTTDWAPLGIDSPDYASDGVVFGTPDTLEALGVLNDYGAVVDDQGRRYSLSTQGELAPHLAFLEPLVLAQQRHVSADDRVSVLVIVAARSDLVSPLSTTIESMVQGNDPASVSVDTSDTMAALQGLVQGQLGDFGRSITLGILLVTGGLTGTVLLGMANLRRKDFGRRRALGASRGLIMSLLLMQTALLASAGALLGSAAASIVLVATNAPLPSWKYIAGVALLALGTALASSLGPAIYAASREPIKELRVP